MGKSGDDTLLDVRVAELGIAQTDVGIGIHATITPQSLALAREKVHGKAKVIEAETMAAPPRAEELAARDIVLPRIAIDGRDPDGRDGTGREYAIVSTIGEGGMGRVHLARQRSLARDVALKTLKPGAPREIHDSLLHEARLTGSLEHPGVIPVHALGVDDDERPMLIMKRVQGVELGVLLGAPEHPSWKGRSDDRLVASVEILSQVCLTVEFAHSRDVIHRDIKPENVMVGGFGEVYLLDWGIATRACGDEPGTLVGTPVYMAPEMALGRAIDARTDVYLLGATLHHILTGSARHGGESVLEVLRAALLSEPFAYPDDVPEELASLANRATARDPAARPASAEAFRRELLDFVRHRSARALTDAALERLSSLETILAEAKDGVPRDLAGAYRLATEARFGLTQSVREHADAEAKDGMRRCLTMSIELELRQGHADTADAFLREMDPPAPELGARIEAVRARAVERERERARLENLEHDLDPTEHASKRTVPLLLFSGVLLSTGAWIVWHGSTKISVHSMIAAAFFSLLVIGLAYIILGKRLLTNAFNRRLSALILAGTVTVLLHRFVALVTGAAPDATLSSDLLIFALAMGAAAITLLRHFWVCASFAIMGCAATRVWPAQAPMIFTITLFVSLLTGTAILARVRRNSTSS